MLATYSRVLPFNSQDMANENTMMVSRIYTSIPVRLK